MKLQSTGDDNVNPITLDFNNEHELYELLEIIQQLKERAAEIASVMNKLEGRRDSISDEEITFEDGSIYAEYEEYLGCNNYETHTFHIPLSYFFDENFIEDAKEKIRKRKEEEKRKKEEREAKRKLEAEKREREQYLKLKEKYDVA